MEAEIIETIAPAKEVDAFTLINKGKSTSNLAKFTPSAPGGINWTTNSKQQPNYGQFGGDCG